MLKLRVLTAIILIPLVIAGIFYLPPAAFFCITLLVFSLAAWEWAKLSGLHSVIAKLIYVCAVNLSMLLITRWLPQFAILVVALGALWWGLITLWLLKMRNAAKLTQLSRHVLLLIGLIVMLPCWHALLWLAHEPDLLFFMLVMIWICDSAAYFGGRCLGKRKLAVTLSPNKTLEGFYTAVFVTIIASFAWTAFIAPRQLALSWLLPVLLLIIAAVTGDLFESALKRMQNVKDSGGLLPGHGGILDRIDSLTAAAPVFVCAVIFLRQAGL